MNTPSLPALILALTLPLAAQSTSEVHSEKTITKIAFGSCNNPRDKTPAIFNAVIAKQPDVFVFLGDNIYGDTKDMDVLKKKYQELEAVEDFRKLRESTTMLATWDDHDFGTNDGGNTYPKRKESQQIFLDFFKDPADSPRRTREERPAKSSSSTPATSATSSQEPKNTAAESDGMAPPRTLPKLCLEKPSGNGSKPNCKFLPTSASSPAASR